MNSYRDSSERAAAAAPPAESYLKKNLQPYGGYYTNQIPAHDPELTEVGPGTPMGEYMRRFWHPVCMSLELSDTPRFLKILGEELERLPLDMGHYSYPACQK